MRTFFFRQAAEDPAHVQAKPVQVREQDIALGAGQQRGHDVLVPVFEKREFRDMAEHLVLEKGGACLVCPHMEVDFLVVVGLHRVFGWLGSACRAVTSVSR